MSRQSPIVRPTTISVGRFRNKERGVLSSSVKDQYNSLVTPFTNVYTSPYDHKKGYDDLASSNPYANVSYYESPWQKFLHTLGFRTGKDAYLENMRLQAAEYDNALLQKEYNETYDSPLEQASRERAAGLNPNLTGNVSSGESADLPSDENPPAAAEDDMNSVVSFANGVMNCVQVAYGLAGNVISMAGAIEDVKGKKLANRLSSWNLGQQLSNFAEDAVYRNLPAGLNIRDFHEVNNYYNLLKRQYGDFMSKKDFKRFIQLANDFQNNVNIEGKYWRNNKDYHESRQGAFNIGANSLAYSEDDAVMYVMQEGLSKLATQVWKSESKNRITKADYESTYLESMNPEQMANAETVRKVNEATISGHEVGIKSDEEKMLDLKVSLRSTYQYIMNGLDGLIKDGNNFASIVKMALSTFMLKLLPTM